MANKLERFTDLITCLRRHQKVNMLGHEDIGVVDAPMLLGPILEAVKIGHIVFITKENRLEAVARLIIWAGTPGR